jgi:hypothetical protein
MNWILIGALNAIFSKQQFNRIQASSRFERVDRKLNVDNNRARIKVDPKPDIKNRKKGIHKMKKFTVSIL